MPAAGAARAGGGAWRARSRQDAGQVIPAASKAIWYQGPRDGPRTVSSDGIARGAMFDNRSDRLVTFAKHLGSGQAWATGAGRVGGRRALGSATQHHGPALDREVSLGGQAGAQVRDDPAGQDQPLGPHAEPAGRGGARGARPRAALLRAPGPTIARAVAKRPPLLRATSPLARWIFRRASSALRSCLYFADGTLGIHHAGPSGSPSVVEAPTRPAWSPAWSPTPGAYRVQLVAEPKRGE